VPPLLERLETMTISISVVIPLFNKGPHIERALKSVFAQTHPPFEILVVDDASTDDGLDRVRALESKLVRILHRTQPGPGGYAARNLGIEEAKGGWIAFLDADDTWEPHWLEEVALIAQGIPPGVTTIFGRYFRQYADGRRTESPRVATKSELDLGGFLDSWLSVKQSPMWTSAVVATRNALLEAGMFPAGRCNRGGDKDTWLRLLAKGSAVASDKIVATYFRDTVNMVTKGTSTNQRPYLCGTLDLLIDGRPTDVADKLSQLKNLEMYTHARDSWRNEQSVRPEVFRGFDASRNPLQFLALHLMSRSPSWLTEALLLARRTIQKI
jgi:succinoglycan biosynthesis protein ExoO